MTGYESARIPNGGENPESWEHPKIKEAFEPLGATEAYSQAQQYWQVRQLWDQGVRTFARSIQNSISQAWTGAAAEESKRSIQEYTAKAEELTPTLEEMYTRVRDAADAIIATKKALPDPVVITWTSWLWPPNRWELQREQSQEEQAARAAMQTHYVQPFSEIDAKIPVLPTPVSPTSSPDITVPPGGFGGGSGSSDGSGNPSSNGPGGGDQPGSPSGQEEQPQPGEETEPADQQDDSSTNQSSQGDDSTEPSSQDPASTDPASTNPAGTNPSDPGRTVPSGSNPSSPGSGSPGSPGSGSPGSPGSAATPQPGRSIPGVPGSAVVPGQSAPAAAAAAGGAMRGMGGMGMAGAPGARGGGQDDDTHQIPDYLVTQENTDELLGELPPTVPGGVIGGDAG
ncbi:hypothetical protein [Nocardia farcinica]|uniref:hypothetical protein n=1 Tax=Nocardia farcinica TaxID=37329 RepID=UPI000E02A750|nr:hypothetical protein [Nocardia farcinica]MBF6068724.1 hypothetical protein [Nocardia farcinica]SUE27460.1 Uncharacterised protein [Nocardia farcinica]